MPLLTMICGKDHGKPKGVRQPRPCASVPEFRFVEPVSIEELAHKRFSARHLAVLFDPRGPA